MGGIGIGLRYPFQINAGNPASYTAIDSMSFVMEFGIFSKHTTYLTTDEKNGSNNLNFDYLAFSYRINKNWASAFGVMPMSHKGYNVQTTDSVNDIKSVVSFNGNGSLSKAFLGNAFNIGKRLSIGINIWYMFGTLVDQTYIYIPKDINAYDYLSSNILSVHNFGVTTGLQYHFVTKKKNTFTFGAVFEPSQDISSSYLIHTERALFRGSSAQTPIIDTIQNVSENKNGLVLPVSYGGGFSYTVKNKMVFGADYYHQQWSKATFLGTTPEYLTNRSRYSAGFEIIPNENSIKSYWARTNYRLGFFYEDSYLMLNEKQISSYGLTMGLGLPFPRSRSSFNLSAEIGRLGTTENDLIKESYLKFTLHILLYDRWFMKRKFE